MGLDLFHYTFYFGNYIFRFKTMNKIIFTLIFLSSCITPWQDLPYAGLGIDDEFHPYVQKFEQEWGHQVTNVDIVFVAFLPGTTAAECFQTIGSAYQRYVRVAKDKWTRYPPELKEILIFHELGHCSLNKKHNDYFDSSGRPLSIMNSDISDVLPWWYGDHKKYLIKELFSR